MKCLSVKTAVVAIAGLMACMVYSSICYGEDRVNVKLIPSGYAAIDEGLVVHSGGAGLGNTGSITGFTQVNNVWLQRFYGGFGIKSIFDPLPFEANIGIELKALNETPPAVEDAGASSLLNYFAYLTRADVVYTMGNKEKPALRIDAGYFPFKYNPEARNLGEYLFRTGAYPEYIISNFDFALERVAGVDVGGIYHNLKWDVLLTNNIQYATFGDINLTGVVSYKPIPAIDIGAGVQFASLISMYHNRTTPELQHNSGNYYYTNSTHTDSAAYTFAGTKLMARIALDLKQYLSVSFRSKLGTEDLKLYSEAALLGLKDYPGSADTNYLSKSAITNFGERSKRIPVMIGLNVPTFKLLDVLSFECEWFGSKNYNDMTSTIMYGLPTTSPASGAAYSDSTNDDLKWSIYGKKVIGNHLNISFQFASDHLRWDGASYVDQTYRMGEALTNTNQWYWIVKLGYSF